jgi:hypothetical protein
VCQDVEKADASGIITPTSVRALRAWLFGDPAAAEPAAAAAGPLTDRALLDFLLASCSAQYFSRGCFQLFHSGYSGHQLRGAAPAAWTSAR